MADLLDTLAPDVDFNAEPEAETPVVVAEPQLETPEPIKEAPKEEQKPEKVVPLAALHESRMKEREWREKASQIEKDAQERFQKLEARLEKLVNPPPAVPRFEDDPAGNLQHEVQATKAELAALRQTSEQSHKEQEVQRFEQQIATSTQAAEAAFAKEHPDYLAAVQHLQSIADKNLQMMGVEDPTARQAQIRQDALAMSLKALQMGKSPAEVAYQLAVNYGYRAGSVQASEAAKKITTIQEGQKTNSMPSGGSKSTPLTLQALESMDDDDFNKLVDDPTAWNKLVRQMV
jgi:hypothetical protein